ncbi:MAG: entericidin EcnAB [Azonexus sp.]|nr:entericidin EcnAB [Azonexus sp.]
MKTGLILLLALALAACNTAEGIKKDAQIGVEKTGEAIKKGGEAVGEAMKKGGEAVQKAVE